MPIEDEGHAMDEVVDRLALRFPGASGAEIRAQVESLLATFDGAVVRDFVPVLVEHEAGEQLAQTYGFPQ